MTRVLRVCWRTIVGLLAIPTLILVLYGIFVGSLCMACLKKLVRRSKDAYRAIRHERAHRH